MASFTDAISTFNPYVQQLPVEAMVKVGMQKQQQYDQGVEKIQAYIDNISGLEIANDADKQYVQSKLNSLGSNLASIAGADFSNQQLVTSVGGMANQIIKDEKVLNAVASTANYKKQKSQLDKDYQAGKSSIANVSDFNDQASLWLNSKEPGGVFNGKYSPYIDVQQKWLDVMKTLHPSALSQDFAYDKVVGADGKPDVNKIAAAMTRISKEGVSAKTIENAIRTSITPDMYNQLRIDAKYRFKGLDQDGLRQTALSEYDGQIKNIDSVVKKLEGVANLNSSNPQQKQLALDTINDLNSKKITLKTNLEKNLGLINENVDTAKAEMYKEGYINQFATSYSWEKQALELLNNPVLEADFKAQQTAIAKGNLEVAKESLSWRKTVDAFDMKDKDRKYQLEVDKTFGQASGFEAYLGAATGNLPNPIAALSSDINASKATSVNGVAQLANKLKTSASAIEASLIAYQNGDEDAIPKESRGTADMILKARADAKVKERQLLNAKETVLNANPSLRAAGAQIDRELASKPGISILAPDGNRYKFSQKEIFDYLNKEKVVRQYSPIGGVARKSEIGIDPALMSDKERALYNFIGATRYGGSTNVYGVKADAGRRKILNVFSEYAPIAKKYAKHAEDINLGVSNHLMNTSGKYTPAMSNINTPTAESRQMYEGIASTALRQFTGLFGGTKGGDALLSQDEIIKGQTWLTQEGGKADVQYKKLKYGDKTYLMLSKGTEDIAIPLSRDQAAKLPSVKGESNAYAEEVADIQRANGNGNTNATGKISDAHFQRYTMPNLKNVFAVADLQSDDQNPAIQYLNLAIKTPTGFKNLQIDDYPMDAVTAKAYVNNLTDDKIITLYLNSNKVPAAWKELIRNLK